MSALQLDLKLLNRLKTKLDDSQLALPAPESEPGNVFAFFVFSAENKEVLEPGFFSTSSEPFLI